MIINLASAAFYITALTWAQSNAGVISAVGALIIFFSWVVTNTLGQKYGRLKSSVESAQSTFRLYTKLNELRNSLHSLAMEVVQNKNSADASMFMPGRTGDSEVDRVRTEFSLTRLSAHQIKELMNFTVETHSFSRSVGTTTDVSRKIESLLKEVDNIYRPAIDQEREVEQYLRPETESFEDFKKGVKKYVAFIRGSAIPKVPHPYSEIVSASNTRHSEGRKKLDKSKRRYEKASKAALALYILGSILTLSGQYLDKTKPTEKAAPVTQQNQ